MHYVRAGVCERQLSRIAYRFKARIMRERVRWRVRAGVPAHARVYRAEKLTLHTFIILLLIDKE